MTNRADPDQLASSSEANWSGSTLFTKVGEVMNSRIRGKVPSIICSRQHFHIFNFFFFFFFYYYYYYFSEKISPNIS